MGHHEFEIEDSRTQKNKDAPSVRLRTERGNQVASTKVRFGSKDFIVRVGVGSGTRRKGEWMESNWGHEHNLRWVRRDCNRPVLATTRHIAFHIRGAWGGTQELCRHIGHGKGRRVGQARQHQKLTSFSNRGEQAGPEENKGCPRKKTVRNTRETGRKKEQLTRRSNRETAEGKALGNTKAKGDDA